MRPACLIAFLVLGPAMVPDITLAQPPAVVTDTAPVQSLTAMVMGDLGTPGRLIAPGTSPHGAALRPSDAAALAAADVVIWTGPDLVPQLADPISALAPGARVLSLLESPGWSPLPLREDADFDTGGHDHQEGHDHGHIDPHAWLDPAVAAVWVDTIAATLAAADPDNAAIYRANATDAGAGLAALDARVRADLAPLAGRGWLVPHDAYQYFEAAFGLPAAGALSLSDAAPPGPAHVAALRDRLARGDIICLLTDVETPPDLVALVIGDSAIRTARADPDGISLAPGPGLYADLVQGIAAALVDCLG